MGEACLALCFKKIVPCSPLSAQGTGLGFALCLCYQVIVYFWGDAPPSATISVQEYLFVSKS